MPVAEKYRKSSQGVIRFPKYFYVIVLGLVVFGPLSSLVFRAISGDGLTTLVQYRDFGQILSNTVLLALGSLVVALVLGTSLAVAVYKSPAKWQGFLSMIPLTPMVIPGVAEVMGWVFLLSPRAGYLNAFFRSLPGMQDLNTGPVDIFSFEWIVLLTGFSFTGFVYLYVSNSLAGIGTELEAAASVNGASNWKIFWSITFPLIRPAIVYSSGIVLLLGLGQFTGPLILGSPKGIDVLSTILFKTKETYPVDYALGAAISAPLIIAGLIVMFLQRKIIGNQQKYTVVTGKSNLKIGKGSKLASIPVLVFGFVAVLLPIIALVMVAISSFWTANFSFDDTTTKHILDIFNNPRTMAALGTTINAIFFALLFVIPIGFISASIQSGAIRMPKFIKLLADLLTTLPLSMPAAILGFAMLYTYANPPFSLYGTLIIFVITYITLMIPHATRPQLAEMLSVGNEFSEAAAVSGSSKLKILLTIELPLYRKGISVSVTMVVILLFHEFAASLMIATPGVQTVGTLLYDYYTGGIYPQVAVLALLMVVVTFIGVTLSVLIGGKKALVQ